MFMINKAKFLNNHIRTVCLKSHLDSVKNYVDNYNGLIVTVSNPSIPSNIFPYLFGFLSLSSTLICYFIIKNR
jgi:hypothetical protein